MGGGDRSAAHYVFFTLLGKMVRSKMEDAELKPDHMPFRLLLLQHLINFVFPNNEDRGAIEKYLKQRLLGQSPFVLFAAALQCPKAPLLHPRLILLIDPRIFLEAEDLPPYTPYQELG